MNTATVTPELLAFTGPLAIEAAQKGDGKSLPKFDMTAYTGGLLQLAGWYYPVVVDLDGLQLPESLPILKDHQASEPVGHGSARVVKGELFAQGVLSVPGEIRERITESAKSGFPWQASIGAKPLVRRRIQAGEKIRVNGKVSARSKGDEACC